MTLGAGRHTLRVQESPQNLTGFDVKRLVLASGAGGAAITAASIAAPSATSPQSAPRSAPRVHVVSQGRTSMKVRVDPTDKPFWFVLGESNNAGWTASANGRDLGAPQLVDGYANGWRVAAARGGGPMTITVSWAPQRLATLSIWISLIAALACIGIVIAASVRRRRRNAKEADVAIEAPAVVDVLRPAALAFSTRATVLTVGATAVVSALLVRPWVGLLVGALTLLAIRRPRWRLLLKLGPAVIVAGVALYMAAGQYLDSYPARFDWPTFYSAARTPAWIAVVLLGADAAIEVVSRARRVRKAPKVEPVVEERIESEPRPEPATP